MVVASMATAKVRRCESLAGSPACLADRYNDPCGRHATIVRTPSRSGQSHLNVGGGIIEGNQYAKEERKKKMEGITLQEHFATLEDPRVERTKRHQLLAIIAIALCAVICGADTWVDVEEFGKSKRAWLETFLELPNGIPSHDTFGRVFARLDPEQFQACFLSWVQAINAVLPTQQIAIDGKTARRSHQRAEGKAAMQMVSAWASASHLVLAQRHVAEHSNEKTALPFLLEQLDPRGAQRDYSKKA